MQSCCKSLQIVANHCKTAQRFHPHEVRSEKPKPQTQTPAASSFAPDPNRSRRVLVHPTFPRCMRNQQPVAISQPLCPGRNQCRVQFLKFVRFDLLLVTGACLIALFREVYAPSEWGWLLPLLPTCGTPIPLIWILAGENELALKRRRQT
ncbi:hypothetical protein F5144DRAFT_2581 [Chaetomium tenue]|uniref:Uncharacterized protein n=1 Tax=Chaetomium tenue TaxID=1854479 RepID=A0ACB7PJA8_9PEZI|nr:hypothetical protein F5144DRAFT_2581 [Chaetomium globosum]